jgi:hypothetical protein
MAELGTAKVRTRVPQGEDSGIDQALGFVRYSMDVSNTRPCWRGSKRIHAETVTDGWADEITALDLHDQLDRRYDLTFEEYEAVHDVHNHEQDADLAEFTAPEEEFVFDGWGEMGERQYAYVG